MTTRTITTTQLRGMIKEALEESVQEIAVDEQIAALKAKGGRRNLQENKQYRKLLEFKMGGLTELSALRDEEGVNPELLGFKDVGEVEGATLSGDSEPKFRVAVDKALQALAKARTVSSRMEDVDTKQEIVDFIIALTHQLMQSADDPAQTMGGRKMLMFAANKYDNMYPESKSSESSDNRQLSLPVIGESRRRFLRRR
jgi:hypothetical protein